MKNKNAQSVINMFLILASSLVFTSCGAPSVGGMSNSLASTDMSEGYYKIPPGKFLCLTAGREAGLAPA